MAHTATPSSAFHDQALDNIRRFHGALKEKEPLQQTPQLWRAVQMEDLVYKYVNSCAGKKRSHDFQKEPLMIQNYQQITDDVMAYIHKKRDSKYWEKVDKSQVKTKAMFHQFLEEKGLKKPKREDNDDNKKTSSKKTSSSKKDSPSKSPKKKKKTSSSTKKLTIRNNGSSSSSGLLKHPTAIPTH